MGAGVNTIDVDTATRLHIAVANMPGANAPSVAEGTLLLMLAALRRLPALDRATREGRGWPPDPQLGETVRDIGGCTVGLVGYGNIAKQVETIVAAMGATVLHTSTRDDALPGWKPLPELLAASDIVSLHLPLTDDTDGLIDRAALASMKPGAVLVNTSRGAIVDEDALADALRDGRLAAAGLDVFGVEPVPLDHPLLGLDNVVLTPHVTWYTVDTMRRYLVEAVANCRRLRDGQPLAHVVNQPTGCELGSRALAGPGKEGRRPMPIAINPEHQDLADSVRSLVARIAPSEVLHDALETPLQNPPPYWQAAADQGLQGVHLAESVGGQGFGILELAVVLAEFGYGAVPGPFVPSAIASALISAHDPDAKVLADLASGNAIAAYALDSGLTATCHGNSLVIRGEVRAVPAAAQASLLVLPVAIDSGEEWVVLDADTLEIEPVKSVDPLRPLAHVRANAVEVGD